MIVRFSGEIFGLNPPETTVFTIPGIRKTKKLAKSSKSNNISSSNDVTTYYPEMPSKTYQTKNIKIKFTDVVS